MTMIAMLLALSALAACAVAPIRMIPANNNAVIIEEDAEKSLTSDSLRKDLNYQYQIECKTYRDSVCAEDGTELAVCQFVLPEMHVYNKEGKRLETTDSPKNSSRSQNRNQKQGQKQEEETALAIAETFNEQFFTWTKELGLEELAELSQTNRTRSGEQNIPWSGAYEIDMTCEVYQTERLVSITAVCSSDTGGAHPNRVLLAWNFDLTSGKFFTPEILAENGPIFSRMVQVELLQQSQTHAVENGTSPENYFWENYREILSNWSSYAVSFDDTGMTIGFSPYELASYAAGNQIYHLDYEQLKPYLSDYGRLLLDLEKS